MRIGLEDPPHVPPGDEHTLLARLTDLVVYGMPMLEGVLVHANLKQWCEPGMVLVLMRDGEGETSIPYPGSYV